MGVRYAEYVPGVVEIRNSYRMISTNLKGRHHIEEIIAGGVKIINRVLENIG